MKIKIGNCQVVIFQVTRLETCKIELDKSAVKQQVDEIVNDAFFQNLRSQVAAIRAAKES